VVDNKLKVADKFSRQNFVPYIDTYDTYDYEWNRNRPRYPSKSDWRLKEDILDELFWSPFVDSDDVNVEVKDGRVTLTGTVDSWSEYNAAADNAYEGGAVYVDNDLVVGRP
jgi:HSP20 family molecular chaperone IbpA